MTKTLNNTLMGDTIEARKLTRDPITVVDPNATLTSLKTSSVASVSAMLHPHQADRQSLDNQLAQLTKHIQLKLRQVAALVQRGRFDQAGIVCQIVATDRMRLHDLIDQRNAKLALPIIDQAEPVQRQAKGKTIVKPKRYARFSEK